MLTHAGGIFFTKIIIIDYKEVDNLEKKHYICIKEKQPKFSNKYNSKENGKKMDLHRMRLYRRR